MIKSIYRFVLLLLLTSGLLACKQDSLEGGDSHNGERSFECGSVSVEDGKSLSESELCFRLVSIEEGGDDEGSPMGYWESLKTYPKIYGAIDPAVKLNVNNSIVALANRYACDELGDYSFSSDVGYFDENLLSLSYEVMWMCSAMPSPDSTVGALVINLITGAPVILEGEFMDASSREMFYSDVANKMKGNLEGESYCSGLANNKGGFDFYYKAKNTLAFISNVDRHSDSGCIDRVEYTVTAMRKYLNSGSVLLSD